MEKKIAILIILMTSVYPISYAILYFFPPEGMIFNGLSTDESMFLTAIKISDFGFESPWILDSDGLTDNILSNPGYGPIYLMQIPGFFYAISGLSPLLLFVLFKFFSGILFLIITYFLLKELTESEKETRASFFIFTVTAGFGGLLFIIFRLATDPSLVLAPTSLFGFGIGAFRILDAYQAFPFAMAHLSFLFLIKKRYYLSGIFLGLTLVFYAFYAFAILTILLLYSLLHDKLTNFLKIFAIAAPFGAFLILPMLMNPLFFQFYGGIQKSLGGHNLPSLFLGFGLPAFIVIYELYRKWHKDPIHVKRRLYHLLWVIAIGMLAVSQVAQSYWLYTDANINKIFLNLSLLDVLSFVNVYGIFFELPFFILLAKFILDFIKRKNDFSQKYFFIAALFILVVFLTMAPLQYVPWVPNKIGSFLALPVALIAAKGAIRFSEKHSFEMKKILALILILSLPSLFLFHVFVQNLARDINFEGIPRTNDFYYFKSDYDALLFLKGQEDGVLLSSGEIGSYTPVYSNKEPLLVGNKRPDIIFRYDEKEKDYNLFYSNSSTEKERKDVIDKYGIDYVFYGPIETGVSMGSFNPDDMNFFEKIYENGMTKLYRVIK